MGYKKRFHIKQQQKYKRRKKRKKIREARPKESIPSQQENNT